MSGMGQRGGEAKKPQVNKRQPEEENTDEWRRSSRGSRKGKSMRRGVRTWRNNAGSYTPSRRQTKRKRREKKRIKVPDSRRCLGKTVQVEPDVGAALLRKGGKHRETGEWKRDRKKPSIGRTSCRVSLCAWETIGREKIRDRG